MANDNSTAGSESSCKRLLAAAVDEFHERLRHQTVITIILGLMVGWVLPQVGVGVIGATIVLYVNRIWGDSNCPYGDEAKLKELFNP